MSTYAIGDIHGCYHELLDLLSLIKFDPQKDQLWFSGDLVNRGPHSLETLRFIKNLGSSAILILGNNDLSFVTVFYGHRQERKQNYTRILEAPDCDELANWLCHQKLLHYDQRLNAVITHAGIYPYWNLEEAITYATETEKILLGSQRKNFLGEMFGNFPDKWLDHLTGWDRYRFIINAFTRMRYCTEDGKLDFHDSGPLGTQKNHLVPWYQVKNRKKIQAKIIFGHWASLLGKPESNDPNLFAIDTGCGWGHSLLALRLEDLRRFSVKKT